MPASTSSHQSQPPIRRCIICKQTAAKAELLRVVRKADGKILLSTLDQGRGAYVHPDPNCLLEASTQPKHLSRALRRTATDDILDQLNRLLEAPAA
jgi:hypothetical protein